ncbi:MAG: lipoate--protein ligase family protein [Gemmatimonadota bacterium]
MSETITTWHLLETGPRPGAWNMACDEALLDAVGSGEIPPTVRFYAWGPPAVSLGRHQPDLEPSARAALAALGIDWVRRPTGGRLVYHGTADEELTYSVVAPLDEPSLAGGLSEAYRRIHEALATGLARLGIAAALAPRPSSSGRGAHSPRSRLACFAASVPNEIVADGRKLVGSAQRRSRRSLLQHGSIPLGGDPAAIPARIWPGCLEATTVTTVSAAAGRAFGFDEAVAALAAGIEEKLNVRLEPGVLSEGERDAIRARLADEVPMGAAAASA